jgi:hypothetical protein
MLLDSAGASGAGAAQLGTDWAKDARGATRNATRATRRRRDIRGVYNATLEESARSETI